MLAGQNPKLTDFKMSNKITQDVEKERKVQLFLLTRASQRQLFQRTLKRARLHLYLFVILHVSSGETVE